MAGGACLYNIGNFVTIMDRWDFLIQKQQRGKGVTCSSQRMFSMT